MALGGCETQAQGSAAAAGPERTLATTTTRRAGALGQDELPRGPESSTPALAELPSPNVVPTGDPIPLDGPRVYALSRNVWIRSAPTSDVQWIGLLWMGGSVRVRSAPRVPGAGCGIEWVPIEPRGWVCVDEKRATANADHPQLRRIYPYRPKVETPFPHRYALVHAPLARYLAPPTEEVQRARERGYLKHIDLVRAARAAPGASLFPSHLGHVTVALTGEAPPPFPLLQSGLPDLPPGLSEGRTSIAARSALAYAARADVGDRAFLLAADLSWVPQDRVELLEPVEFRGVPLGPEYRLPLAGIRGKARPAYRFADDGTVQVVPDHFKRLSFVNLASDVRQVDDRTLQRVEGSELWIDQKDAVIPEPQRRTPWGALVGQADDTGLAPAGRATWVEASVLGGWLLAFEGTRPVYATLISAGRGGTPQPGRDPLETASTPVGRFHFTGKFKTATMESSSTPIVHGDVPWTQNFSGPHALHSAYWHDDWGNLKSAGCVNVSPRDGKWLFEFTEPPVPEGWHGVRYLSRDGPATEFVLHQ